MLAGSRSTSRMTGRPQKRVVYRYDAIVLDRDLPGVHGDAVCVALRDRGADARILMLTAAAAIGDRVEGLNLGADDCLPKPLAFEELVTPGSGGDRRGDRARRGRWR